MSKVTLFDSNLSILKKQLFNIKICLAAFSIVAFFSTIKQMAVAGICRYYVYRYVFCFLTVLIILNIISKCSLMI